MYEWSTIKNYLVVAGHFGRFLALEKVIDASGMPVHEWYGLFKIAYEQAIHTASVNLKLVEAERAKKVSCFEYVIVVVMKCFFPTL